MSTQNTAPATAADLFGDGAVGSTASKYNLDGRGVRSLCGGIVDGGRASGADSTPLLVHTAIPGRREQAIDMGAVASGVCGGVIPLPLLVAGFAKAGTLAELEKAIAEHKKAS